MLYALRYFVVGALAVLAVPAIGGLGLMTWLKFADANRYGRDGTDYHYVTSEIVQMETVKPGLVQWRNVSINPHRINGDDWQFMCVIGAYNDPVEILTQEAIRRSIDVSSIDPVPTQALGLAPVEENEGAISFVDGKGRGRTILIDGFQRVAGQHARHCFGREVTTMTLPFQAE
jgi:hypothetical protein